MKSKLTKEQKEIIDNLTAQFQKLNDTADAPNGTLIDFSAIMAETDLKKKNLNVARILNDSAESYRRQVIAADIEKLNRDLQHLNFIAIKNQREEGGELIGIVIQPVNNADSDFKMRIEYSSKHHFDKELGHTIHKNSVYVKYTSRYKFVSGDTIEEVCADEEFKKRLSEIYQKINVK